MARGAPAARSSAVLAGLCRRLTDPLYLTWGAAAAAARGARRRNGRRRTSLVARIRPTLLPSSPMSRPLRAVCVFCGSRPGDDPAFTGAAAAMGRAIAGRGLTLVYGGARVGLMGTLANAALAAGGRVVGVI